MDITAIGIDTIFFVLAKPGVSCSWLPEHWLLWQTLFSIDCINNYNRFNAFHGSAVLEIAHTVESGTSYHCPDYDMRMTIRSCLGKLENLFNHSHASCETSSPSTGFHIVIRSDLILVLWELCLQITVNTFWKSNFSSHRPTHRILGYLLNHYLISEQIFGNSIT